MKITKTIKGWEPFKYSKKDQKAWLDDMFKDSLVYSEHEVKNLSPMFGDPPLLKKPKKCKLTITYEVED